MSAIRRNQTLENMCYFQRNNSYGFLSTTSINQFRKVCLHRMCLVFQQCHSINPFVPLSGHIRLLAVVTDICFVVAEDKLKNGYMWMDWMCLPRNHLENNLETWNEKISIHSLRHFNCARLLKQTRSRCYMQWGARYSPDLCWAIAHIAHC